MMIKLAFTLLLLASIASTCRIGSRVRHNGIEAMSNPKKYSWLKRYTPMIRFDHGCYSYPAVDIFGNYNGGLRPGVRPGGGCRTSRFLQVYTRQWYPPTGRYYGMVMFAYFFAKDQGNRRLFSKVLAHRYDWEEVIVFFDKRKKMVGATASHHGGYRAVGRHGSDAKYWSGNHVKVSYGVGKRGSFSNNAMHFTTKGSTDRLKIFDWYTMSAGMKCAINSDVWGRKTSPKNSDGNMARKIYEATQVLERRLGW